MKKKKLLSKKNIVLIVLVSLTIISSIIVLNTKETVVKGNITIWTDNTNYDYLSQISSEFVKNNEKCKVNVVKMDEDNIDQNLQEALKKNKLPDLFSVSNEQMKNILENENYKDKIKSSNFVINKSGHSMTKRDLQSCFIDGEYKAIPYNSAPLLLYLREDMLNIYGFSYKDINTWQDLINVGKVINEKSQGKVNILNSVGKDKDYLISLLTMQIIEEYKTNDDEITAAKVKVELKNKYATLVNNNILNTAEEGQFFARISSVEAMNELSALDADCEWTANYVPSLRSGGNKLFIGDGRYLMIFNNGEQKDALISKFVNFIGDNDLNGNLLTDKKFFLSYPASYESYKIDQKVNNFSGKSPLIYLANVSKKAPEISEYDIYKTVIAEINY